MSEGDLSRYVWRKSSRSDTRPDQCVELAAASRTVAVRDSKDPDGPKLAFARAEWSAFTRHLKDGTFQGS